MKVWRNSLLVLVIIFLPAHVDAAVVTFLTSGVSYSTPADWDNSNNSIECIGPGGNGGANNAGGAGGGGGAYAKITNLTLSGSISYVVGGGGTLNDTYFNGAASTTASLSCAPGKSASGVTAGAGGLTANSTGSTKFAGGDGGSGGGGGGAGGTTGAGNIGVTNGGDGGTASGGLGGLAGGCCGDPGEQGGTGTVWDVSHGAGGGGGQGAPADYELPDCFANGGPGGAGGLYGGGAGGGGPRVGASCLRGDGGVGAQGIIVTTYTPAAINALVAGLRLGVGAELRIAGGGLKLR